MDNTTTKLTLKQRKWLNSYMETGNATEAARQAGYSGTDESLAVIGFENLRKLNPQITELMDQMGLTDASLMLKLVEGLDAVVTEKATFEGAITDERTYVDFLTRFKYLDMALKLKGKYPAKAIMHSGPGGGAIPFKEIVAILPPEEDDDNGKVSEEADSD
jgi:phage terminase small subunit